MAQKNKRRNTAYRKEANAEFHKGDDNAFTGGGNAAYQPRDSGTEKPGRSSGGKGQTEKSMQAHQETFGQKVQKSKESQLGEKSTFTENKSMDFRSSDAGQRKLNHVSKVQARKQMYRNTSGQKVQKSDAKPGQEEKPDFVKESSGFTGQEDFNQTEDKEKKQPDAEDYHRRDTYSQSQKKGKYHKKRVQREHRNKGGTKEKAENKTFTEESFTENTGNLFQGEGDSEFTGSKKLQKKQRQAQKAAKKAQKARAKLPKTREYTLQRVFDEKTGKGKYVVVPLDREKPFKQEGIPKTTMRRMQNEGRNFVHGKIAETEKENSAVEGAHKSEQKVEAVYSFVKRQIKGKEQKQRAKVAKLEKKQFKKEVNFQYQKFLEENPQMQKKALQKRLQKQRIKREYIKARKKAAAGKTAEQAFEKTKNGAVTVARKLQEFARRNAGLLVTVGIMALLLMMIMVSVSSCGAMFADTQSTILAASYLSKPEEIDAADLQLTRLELDLQNEIDRVETDYPGYDEYSYNLGAIGHNPFTLISYLSAVHTEFTASGVESEIQALFDEMYTLTLTPDTETRTRTVTKTGTRTVTDPVTGEETEEEYEYEEEDFEPANRKKFCSRIATGDYDAVIIGHSQFEKIPLSTERQMAMIERQIAEIEMAIESLKAENGERYSIKQMEKTKKSLSARLNRLNDSSRKDNVVTFEQLGVDRLFVDESHNYKNLFLYTKMRNVAGIAQTEAQKSSDMFAKCQYMDELTGGKGITFATGTPISNSMTELYTNMRYLQYNTLQRLGLGHFDSWAASFGETQTAIELAPEGTGYRAKTRFAKFFNLPELIALFKESADIQTPDMLKLPVPEADYENIVLKPSEYQQDMVQSLADRAEAVRDRKVQPNIDNMLKITNDGRKLALDQRLINDMLPDEENSKATTCVEKAFEIWEQTKEQKSAQLIFCDLSTPKGDGTFNVYEDIRDKLMAKGVPENEIAFIHNANTETRKAELFAKVRSGQVRFLLGSTAKMGAGTNVQDRLIALHHLDVPWRPSDVGRILRTFKIKKKVEVTDNGKDDF